MTEHTISKSNTTRALWASLAICVLLAGPITPAAAAAEVAAVSSLGSAQHPTEVPFVSGAPGIKARSGYPVSVTQVVGTTVISTNFVSSTSFSSCSIGTAGGTCTITSGRSVDRTIGLSLGITRSAVAASLGISSSATVSTSVSCTSPPLAAGQSWRAFAVGTRYRYQVKKTTFTGPISSYSTTSGYLYAFNPNPSRIHCR